MKYRQLTKEQFEALHEEFALFLAAQQIDVKEWNKIKNEKPDVALQELELFSDVVWERVLKNTHYLEHFSKKSINIFKCDTEMIYRIVVKINKPEINLLSKKGYDWFIDNSKDGSIEYFKGKKTYSKSRNQEIFELIEKGSVLANKVLYENLIEIISK